jgi:Holliday junction resolvase Gen1 C-terminal domain
MAYPRKVFNEQGVKGLGPTFAHGLARCGFGDDLLSAYNSKTEQEFRAFLPQWRQRINDELRTNSRGCLTSRKHNFNLPSDFPCLTTLKNYAKPSTSGDRASPMRDKGELDLAALASLCEDYFEWATADGILNRFRNLVWKVAIMHVFRRSTLEADRRRREGRRGSHPSTAIGSPASLITAHLGPQKKKKADKNARLEALGDIFVNQGTAQVENGPRQYDPSIPDTHPLVKSITLSRCHTSTDGLREYRLQFSPIQFIALTKSGIRKFRPQPETKREPKEPIDPKSDDLLWVSEIVLSKVHPELVDAYLAKEAEKGRKKPGRPRKKNQDHNSSPADTDVEMDTDELQRGSGSQSRLLSQLDAMSVSKSKKSQTKPKRPKRTQQPTSSPTPSQQLPLPAVRARDRVSPAILSQHPPSPRRQFLFTFVDPGVHYDDEKRVNDDSGDSLPPSPPATQESVLLSQPDDFSDARSPVRATARVTAILDTIIDREWGRSKQKGKRKADIAATAAKRPAKKTKASDYRPAAPPSSQSIQPLASSSKISSSIQEQCGGNSSEAKILSPRATAGQQTQTQAFDVRQESRVAESVGRGSAGLHFRYGVPLPDLTDSDDSDLDLILPPPSSQTSFHVRFGSDDIIDLT